MKVQLIETHEPDGHWLKVTVNDKPVKCFKVCWGNRHDRMKEAEEAFNEALKTEPESLTVLKTVEI